MSTKTLTHSPGRTPSSKSRTAAISRKAGSLQSFDDHVLIRRRLRVNWIVFFLEVTLHVRRTIISCSRHRAGRFNRLSNIVADAHYELGSLYRPSLVGR